MTAAVARQRVWIKHAAGHETDLPVTKRDDGVYVTTPEQPAFLDDGDQVMAEGFGEGVKLRLEKVVRVPADAEVERDGLPPTFRP